MGMQFDWGNQEETFIVIKVEGNWTLRECVEMLYAIYEQITAKSRPIDVIWDMRRASKAPMGLISASESLLRDLPEGLRRMIVISRSSVWQSLWSVINTVYEYDDSDFHFVRTVDEAYALVDTDSNDDSDA